MAVRDSYYELWFRAKKGDRWSLYTTHKELQYVNKLGNQFKKLKCKIKLIEIVVNQKTVKR